MKYTVAIALLLFLIGKTLAGETSLNSLNGQRLECVAILDVARLNIECLLPSPILANGLAMEEKSNEIWTASSNDTEGQSNQVLLTFPHSGSSNSKSGERHTFICSPRISFKSQSYLESGLKSLVQMTFNILRLEPKSNLLGVENEAWSCTL